MTKRFEGFEITEKEIDTALRYLKYEKGQEDATREDAIVLIEEHLALAHMLAHKVVDDEKGGDLKKLDSEEQEAVDEDSD